MASRGAKAALLDGSLKRLQAAITRISEHVGIDPLIIPTHDRDPELLMAYQVEAMANWAEALAAHYGLQVETADSVAKDAAAGTPSDDTEPLDTERREDTDAPPADTRREVESKIDALRPSRKAK